MKDLLECVDNRIATNRIKVMNQMGLLIAAQLEMDNIPQEIVLVGVIDYKQFITFGKAKNPRYKNYPYISFVYNFMESPDKAFQGNNINELWPEYSALKARKTEQYRDLMGKIDALWSMEFEGFNWKTIPDLINAT